MRLTLIRILFLLISANVVYGTGGDVYANEVQKLISPDDAHFSYHDLLNADLFTSGHHGLKTGHRSPVKTLKKWSGLGNVNSNIRITRLEYVWYSLSHSIFNSGFQFHTIRRLIFPHHFFL